MCEIRNTWEMEHGRAENAKSGYAERNGQKMNTFVFENSTKVYFGKGCVSEHLAEAVGEVGQTVMLAYGGGSIKKNGVYEEVMTALQAAGKIDDMSLLDYL